MTTPFILRDVVGEDAATSLRVSDYAAHILSWTPASQHTSALWTPNTMAFGEGVALRGGIPVILPWFASGYSVPRRENLSYAPKHGLGRVNFWEYDAQSSHSHLRYTYAGSHEDFGTFHADYEILPSSDELTARLTLHNDNDHPVTFEMALHTYFRVGDVRSIEVYGLQGASYIDAAHGWAEYVQDSTTLTFPEETDRIYLSTADTSILDPVLSRRIHIHPDGTTNTVIWNPGEAGDSFPDMAPGDWRHFVCIEASACKDGAVSIPAGGNHSIAQTIRVADLTPEHSAL
ncbi:D-hexose-6-phosphate mutarotase [Alloscardovia macacae]|uniref:Putative glucose-6-phosphate 1-epimerase n=1 Tax=Alloscardovia macacae TaxID=1160091 RepID=A0A261F3K3_9BIFI|nr:D-hexose-6-phosphate mutarotase [Alloscardovia macacae]OZG53694.1 D-hexose-6-phosphate mutarotase [Alloscardovia macacae]